MATIIWCDHVRHIVEESRTEVAHFIATVQEPPPKPEPDAMGNMPPWDPQPHGFAYFTPIGNEPSRQRALNVFLISSFEAMPGDGI